MNDQREPHNPFYLLLLLASLLFVVTALAYALVPLLEDKAAAAGSPAPPSPFRATLREDGGRWLLWEVAAMIVLGLASMALDRHRLRRLQNARAGATIPQAGINGNPDPSPTVSHEIPRPADRRASGRDQPP